MKTTLLLLAAAYLVYYIYFALSFLLSLHVEARELKRVLEARVLQELWEPAQPELTGAEFHTHFWKTYLPATKQGRLLFSACQPVRLLT